MANSVPITGNLQISTASLQQSTRQIQQALGRITGQASEFQKSLDASTARVFAFGATTSVLQAVNQAFKSIVSTTIEVEKRLIEINSIFQASAKEFNNFRNAIFQVAKDTGQSFSTVADGAAELARQGLSAEETAKRLEAALILTRISGLDAEKSVKSLTAAINGFASAGLTAEQIVNKIVAVDTSFAVSAQDLADGFSRAGSTAEDAGVSFDELLGLITAVEQRTARGGAVIGNAFKSIFTRLSRGDTIEKLKELGVEIDATQTGIQKLQALSRALEEISDPTVASQIKELAGGVYQINVVSSTLKDLSSETSVFAAASKTAAQASSEAFQKNEMLNKSLAAQVNSLVVSLTSLAEKIGQLTFAPLLSNLVKIAEMASSAFDKALDPEKGNSFIQGILKYVGSFISGPGLVMITTAFLKITTLIAKFAKDGFMAVLSISSAQEKNKVIQEGIVRLLQHDAQLRKELANTTLSQAQKEQAVLDAIQRENMLLRDQQALLQNIVALARQKGVSGYAPSTGFSGKNFATGFQQEEVMAQMLGASSGVKAQYGKGTIGGKRFIMNNEEVEIPNFGKNGDSAVLPKYAKGFVPNFAKYTGYDAADILKKSPSAFAKIDITKDKFINSSAAAKAAYEQRKMEVAGKLPPLDINQILGNDMPRVLTPSVSGRLFKTKQNVLGTGRDASFNFRMHRAKVNKNPELKKEFNSFFKKEDMVKMAEEKALKLAQMISAGFDLPPFDPDSINKLTNVEGFYGSIRAAMGGIFDRAMSSAIAINAQKEVGGNFDVNAGKDKVALKRVETIFGKGSIGSSSLADLKIGGGDTTAKSMITKTLNTPVFVDKILKQHAKDSGKTTATQKPTTKSRAAGFIPNFNSLNKGVPVNKIRAHFDEYGNPVAVTNTRDEKNGLKDAIGRERKGIGMAARGFVPNFAVSDSNAQAKSFAKMMAVQYAATLTAGYTSGKSQDKERELEAIREATEAKIQEIKASEMTVEAQREAISAIMKSANSQIEVAEKSASQAKTIDTFTQKAATTLGLFQTVDSFMSGKMTKAIGGLGQFKVGDIGKDVKGLKSGLGSLSWSEFKQDAKRQNVAQVENGKIVGFQKKGGIGSALGKQGGKLKSAGAGILSKAAGPVAAAFGGWEIGSQIADATVGEAERKRYSKELADSQSLMTNLNRKGALAGAARTVGGQGNLDEMMNKLLKAPYEGAKQLGVEIQKTIKAIETGDPTQVYAQKKILIKQLKEAGVRIGDGFQLDDLGVQIKGLSAKIKQFNRDIELMSKETMQTAKAGQQAVGFVGGIQGSENIGAWFDRAKQGESAVAQTTMARQEWMNAQAAFAKASSEGTISKGTEEYDKFKENVDSAAMAFKQSTIDSATILFNNSTMAAKELKDAKTKLSELKFEGAMKDASFIGDLQAIKYDPTVVEKNIKMLQGAKTKEDKLVATQRIAENLKDAPLLTEAIIRVKMGADKFAEVMASMKDVALENSGVTNKSYRGEIINMQEGGRGEQIGQLNTEIKNLESASKVAERRIQEFGEQFQAQDIFAAASRIKTAIDAVATGTESAVTLLASVSSINNNTIQLVNKNNAAMLQAISTVGTMEGEIRDMRQKMLTMQQAINAIRNE